MLKRALRKIDFTVFGGKISRAFAERVVKKQLQQLHEQSNRHKIALNYRKNSSNPIAILCDKYGSDKGSLGTSSHLYPWPPHTFADFYDLLFSARRHDTRFVFECGLGTNNPSLLSTMGVNGKPGASLRVWRDYFPNATIVGADIDRSILFSEARISTYYLDQTDPVSIQEMWNAIPIPMFDIMIDDGLHTFEAGICLFENSIKKLSRSGTYIIEDVGLSELLKFQTYFSDKSYQVHYVNLFRPHAPLENNNLVVITTGGE